MKKSHVLVVAGPTATGKTGFAVNLAKKVNGELINADSRQVYKLLDIGTNKGDAKLIRNYELGITNIATGDRSQKAEVKILPLHTINNVPVHLLSFLDLTEQFSVFDFQQLAYALIEDILSRGKVPIFVGGTGLYIDSVVKNYSLQSNSLSDGILEMGYRRQEAGVRDELNKLSVEDLQKILKTRNSELIARLNNSDRNNKRRLIRLIEKGQKDSGDRMQEAEPQTLNTKHQTLNFQIYYPKYDWDELKEKINSRVDQMFEDGLINEVKLILQKGYSRDLPILQTMGYREVIESFDRVYPVFGTQDDIAGLIEKVKEKVKTAHRQYAKRQRTWFEGKGRGYELEITNY